jgi:hypothetical protein
MRVYVAKNQIFAYEGWRNGKAGKSQATQKE